MLIETSISSYLCCAQTPVAELGRKEAVAAANTATAMAAAAAAEGKQAATEGTQVRFGCVWMWHL